MQTQPTSQSQTPQPQARQQQRPQQTQQPQLQQQRSPQTSQDKAVTELCRIYSQVAELNEEVKDLKTKLKKSYLSDAVAWGVFWGIIASSVTISIIAAIGLRLNSIYQANAEAERFEQQMEQYQTQQDQLRQQIQQDQQTRESQMQELYRQTCLSGNQTACNLLNR